MAGFDADVFGAAPDGPGFDADVFNVQSKPMALPTMPASKPAPPKLSDLRAYGMGKVDSYDPTDSIAGLIRGAGSIGATLLRPFESAEANKQRRAGMDAALADPNLPLIGGANPQSTQFQTNKLLGEIAGTSGVPGFIGRGLRMIPGAIGALPTLIPAIESAGMVANNAKGAYGMVNRVAGGAISGGATAGLVNPADTDAGFMIGGATAPAVKTAQVVGEAVGRTTRTPAINPTLLQTARESVDAGYVIPPNMVRPNLRSQVLESISGKQATQQIASTKNTEVTERLVREALNLSPQTPLTKATLEAQRKAYGVGYKSVADLSPQASADLEALKIARNEAQGWFNAYNRSASPLDLSKAKQFRAEAEALELALEAHAKAAGKPQLIDGLRKARKEIAKTYTVGRALNDASGTVDARVLGRMYEKGLPLSDGLDKAGKFASAFPSVAKSPQQVGSPASHNLKSFGAMLAGGAGYAGLGPAGLAAAAVPFVAPPVARSIMFSGPVQRGLVSPAATGKGLLSQSIDDLSPLLYRSAPLLATSGR